MSSLSALPNEILHHITDNLPAAARAHLSGVSRRLHAVANDAVGWEKLYKREAGPRAYALAAATHDNRTWKQRYSDIHATVQRPYLTPPGLAQPGDIVTVARLRQADGEDAPCEVLSRAHLGLLRVRPLPSSDVRDKPRTLVVRTGHCRDGAKPLLVPAPVFCFKNYEDLGPNDIGEITAELPTRIIFTTALRPGDKVKVHRAALGFSGMPYFMVEEPSRARTVQDLVAIYRAEQRQKAADAAPAQGVMARLSAGVAHLLRQGQGRTRPPQSTPS